MCGVERVEVVNEENIALSTGVLGKHAGEPPLIFLVEGGTECADQFQLRVQIKFVRLGRVRVFNSRAETLRQFVEHDSQVRQEVH